MDNQPHSNISSHKYCETVVVSLSLGAFASQHLVKQPVHTTKQQTHRPQVSCRYRHQIDSSQQLGQVHCVAQFLFSVSNFLVVGSHAFFHKVCNIIVYWIPKKSRRELVRISSIIWSHCFCVWTYSNSLKKKKYCYFGRTLWERNLKLSLPPPAPFHLPTHHKIYWL